MAQVSRVNRHSLLSRMGEEQIAANGMTLLASAWMPLPARPRSLYRHPWKVCATTWAKPPLAAQMPRGLLANVIFISFLTTAHPNSASSNCT